MLKKSPCLAVLNSGACVHGFALHDSWLFARYPRIHPCKQAAFKQRRCQGRLFFSFFLMPVRSAGQIIWGLWPEIFEEIWEGNLPQSGSVGDHSSATQQRAATQDAARSFPTSRLLMSCGCVFSQKERVDKRTAATDIFLDVLQPTEKRGRD